MKVLLVSSTLSLFTVTMSLVSCNNQEADVITPDNSVIANSQIRPIFTQATLDSAILVAQPSDLSITGNPFGTRFNQTEINSIRDIFTNKRPSETLRAGHVFAIRSFQNNNGQRGQLINVHIMVKRERGYNPNGGDFEYINIDFDPQTNYQLNPNGILPALTDGANRGLDVVRFNCVQCHRDSRAGSDFLFTEK